MLPALGAGTDGVFGGCFAQVIQSTMKTVATVHMSEAEVARDPHNVLAKVRQGMSDCFELAKAYESQHIPAPVPDEDFGQDVQIGIHALRDTLEPPKWD